MKVHLLLLSGLVAATVAVDANQTFTSRVWAVLVAGSTGWINYRHQADVCHAYQTLVRKGIPKERIITLMYDDIANNDANPHKGQIFNKPKGPDVYKGVFIDYKGKDVNVNTFRNVLLGNAEALNKTGSGRVLESGEADHVLINFVDHGGTGFFIFPSEVLYAKDLMAILKEMKEQKKYEILVMYIEACNAGSVFDNIISEDDKVFVSTASAPDESSYAWYCENDIDTCLGDLYSITWTERMESLNYSETLFKQFDAIRTATLQRSHANLYGDYSVGFYRVGLSTDQIKYEEPKEKTNGYKMIGSGVDNRDVPVHLALQQVHKAKSADEKTKKQEILDGIIKNRNYGDNLISKIIQILTKGNFNLKKDLETKKYPLDENLFECYKEVMTVFQNKCYPIYKHTYFLKHTYKMANICAMGLNQDRTKKAIELVCDGINDEPDRLII